MIPPFTVVNIKGPIYGVHSDGPTGTHNSPRTNPTANKVGQGENLCWSFLKLQDS